MFIKFDNTSEQKIIKKIYSKGRTNLAVRRQRLKSLNLSVIYFTLGNQFDGETGIATVWLRLSEISREAQK